MVIKDDIVNDFREYAKNPAKWVKRYQDQCRYHHLTKEEIEQMDEKIKKVVPKFKFEIVKNPNRKVAQPFHWRAVSLNGNIVCSSETFRQKQGAEKTIKNLIKAIILSEIEYSNKVVEE